MDIKQLNHRDTPIRPDPLMGSAPLSALIWVEVVVCLGFVALRTWVQFKKMKRFFTNDYFIFLAMICQIATAACYQAQMPPLYELAEYYGNPGPVPSNFMQQSTIFLRLKFTVAFLLWTTLWAVKFSLLFFFWRLFDSVRAKGKWFWWVMVTLTAVTFIVAVVLQFFTCENFEDFFKLDKCTATPRDRYHNDLVFRFAAGTDIGVDFLILLIPFPLLWKLQVQKREKWILVATFLLPVIPILFGIVRLIICDPGNGIVDPVKFPVYSMTENSAAIITSCIPSLRLFAKDPNKGSSKGSANSHRQYNHNLKQVQESGKTSFSASIAARPFNRDVESLDAADGLCTTSADSNSACSDSITQEHFLTSDRKVSVAEV